MGKIVSIWEPVREETHREKLKRQDWYLWILSGLLLVVLGISLLGFMFPSVFWVTRQAEMETSKIVHFGLCILLALTLLFGISIMASRLGHDTPVGLSWSTFLAASLLRKKDLPIQVRKYRQISSFSGSLVHTSTPPAPIIRIVFTACRLPLPIRHR